MKKLRTKQTEIDLTIPQDVDHSEDPQDCFGKEYDPQNKDCSLCADIEICAIKYQESVKAKVKVLEAQNGPTLDMSDFDGVDMTKLEKLAKKYKDAGEPPISFQELYDYIMEQSRSKDHTAVIEYIRRTIPVSKLALQGGMLVCKI